MAKCAVCREDIEREAACPRCGSDNSNVGDLTLGYFGSIWAILSFLLIAVPLFLLLPGVFAWVDGILQPLVSLRVAGPIVLILTMGIAFFMFSTRDELREVALIRSFKGKLGNPLPIWALISFLFAIGLAFLLGFAITNKQMLVEAPGVPTTQLQGRLVYGGTLHFLFQMLLTGAFVLLFALFSVSAGVMAVYEYIQFVEARLPAPIFMNEQLLLYVVLKVVREELDPDVEFRMAGMKRLEDAGISLFLHHLGEPNTAGTFLAPRGWRVEADRWGHVRKMFEQSLSPTEVGKPA